MTILYFDYETNGFPKKPLHLSDDSGWKVDGQCRATQLGAILVQDGRVLAELNVLIKNNVDIHPEITALTGISRDLCDKFGVEPQVAINTFRYLAGRADLHVSHNYDFDNKIASIENGYSGDYAPLDFRKGLCTMLATTDLCKLPSARGGFKWPKLVEAYKHFFNETFDNAHDAMADVRALRRLHEHLVANNLIPLSSLSAGKSVS